MPKPAWWQSRLRIDWEAGHVVDLTSQVDVRRAETLRTSPEQDVFIISMAAFHVFSHRVYPRQLEEHIGEIFNWL